MPEVSGIDLLREVKGDESLRSVPVVSEFRARASGGRQATACWRPSG